MISDVVKPGRCNHVESIIDDVCYDVTHGAATDTLTELLYLVGIVPQVGQFKDFIEALSLDTSYHRVVVEVRDSAFDIESHIVGEIGMYSGEDHTSTIPAFSIDGVGFF